ncbi:MAG: NAD(P)-dependent oxidoreductase [Spirochaetes bacterium]|nr:NAD(P)-dependent oxidoreductase [Spirochaetota bacterium]
MEKILITGVNGFIGSNIAHYFCSRGYDIYGTIREKSNTYLINDLNIKKIICDLNQINEKIFPNDFDYIIHCASIVSDFVNYFIAKRDIFDSTKNFFEKVIKNQNKLKKIIYISTSLVLGYKKLNISEKNPGIPLKNNFYVKFKKEAENYIINFCNDNNINYTILRPADVYGPRDRTSCFHMLKAIERGIPVIVSHGNFVFPFCSSNTLCESIDGAIKFPESDKKIYVVTSGINITWKEFFTFFQKKFKKVQWIYIPTILAKAAGKISFILHKIFPSFKPSLTPYRITRITSNTSYDISETIKDLKINIYTNYEKYLEEIYQWYLKTKESKIKF